MWFHLFLVKRVLAASIDELRCAFVAGQNWSGLSGFVAALTCSNGFLSYGHEPSDFAGNGLFWDMRTLGLFKILVKREYFSLR